MHCAFSMILPLLLYLPRVNFSDAIITTIPLLLSRVLSSPRCYLMSSMTEDQMASLGLCRGEPGTIITCQLWPAWHSGWQELRMLADTHRPWLCSHRWALQAHSADQSRTSSRSRGKVQIAPPMFNLGPLKVNSSYWDTYPSQSQAQGPEPARLIDAHFMSLPA